MSKIKLGKKKRVIDSQKKREERRKRETKKGKIGENKKGKKILENVWQGKNENANHFRNFFLSD